MSGENIQTSATPVTNTEFLSEADRHALEMMKLKRALAISNAEKIELQYNNLILQLSFKYSLTEKDGITDQGAIVRGANAEKV